MSQTTTDATPDAALKARARSMWALGDYPAVADQVIPALGRSLVDACRPSPGERLLDVAAGSGNASVPAALAGAEVVANDLTPELLALGRRRAEEHGVAITWEEGDAEALPYDAGAFDVVLSCVGVMFAPHHQQAADELVRVLRPGGRLGLVAWTPEGFIGQMFATMRPFVPAPPAGVLPPVRWGEEGHVRGLLGDRVRDVVAERRVLDVDRFATPEEFRDFFKACYGPTIAAYRAIGEDAGRVAELDAALLDLGARHAGPDGAMGWEYLLLTAVRS